MDVRIRNVYAKLYKAYGPQGWWPLTPKGEIRTQHHSGKPSSDNDRFEIMIGAVLTQNTAWTNVEKALEQLSRKGLVDHFRLAKASKEKVGGLIRSAGYFNQKADRLVLMSKFVKEFGFGGLLEMETGVLRKILLGLKGVGPETADSIVLYAFEKPSFVIDAYTKRIFSRLGLCDVDVDYDSLQAVFMRGLKEDVGVYQEYHALIVEHAKRHCKTKPVCEGCVISGVCKKCGL